MANTSIQNVFPNAGQVDVLNAALQQIAGKIGVAATIQIVQVNTLPAGEPATVTEAPDSTDSARKYILGIPAGQDGSPGTPGAAAGFGTITATATQLASGEQPTVQAEWSGPDTAKNLTLTFGIPAGPQGPAYTLTESDKQTIVQAVLAALPNAEEVGF